MDDDLRPARSGSDPDRVRRARSWLQASPVELTGLLVLVVGTLVAAGLLWWEATGRPDTVPSAAAQVGAPADVGHLQDGAGGTDPAAQDHPAGHDQSTAGHATGSAAGEGNGPEADAGPLTVHVTGAVAEPGLVVVDAHARVGDAVDAAGGTTADADVARVNLARPLEDGEHVHVPVEGEELPSSVTGSSHGGAGDPGDAAGPVDLNRAGLAELETLPGIGPKKAAAILEHRQTHGPFAQPGDLRAVPGIGEATFQRLADLVTVS